MNILFITSSFYPQLGGVEKHVLHVSLELSKLGHTVTVITPKIDDLPEYETYQNIKIIRFKRNRSKFSIWQSMYKHKKIISLSDIIHLHDYITFLWALPYLIFKIKKYFITFHGWEGKIPPALTTKIARKIIEQLSRGSIAIGHFITKWYNQKPDMILYGGINPEEITPPSKINTISPNFLFYGRISADTEIKNYLKFFKLFSQSYKNSTLTIIGNGPLKKSLIEFTKINQLKCKFIKQTGEISHFIKESDIIFASGYLGILEALANAKLVCALYSNLLKKDYLELSIFNNKILISENIPDLYTILKNCLQDKSKLDELIKANHNFIISQTWSEISNQYLSLWKQTVK